MDAYLLEDGVAGGWVSVVRREVDLLHGARLSRRPVHEQLHLAKGALAQDLEQVPALYELPRHGVGCGSGGGGGGGGGGGANARARSCKT